MGNSVVFHCLSCNDPIIYFQHFCNVFLFRFLTKLSFYYYVFVETFILKKKLLILFLQAFIYNNGFQH